MRLSKRMLVVSLIPVFVVAFVFLMNISGSSTVKQMASPKFVSAYPDPIDVEQPDGTMLTIVMSGDEFTHYSRTADGYTVMMDEKGFYRYANTNEEGDLVMSKVIARNPEIRGNHDINFLKTVAPGLQYSEKQVLQGKFSRMDDQNLSSVDFAGLTNAFPSTGTRRYLVILVNFTDKAFVKTNANFAALYNTNTISFKNYYLATSYNQLTVNTDVYGPYNLSGSMSTYGANDSSGYDINPRLMVQQAVDAAEAAGVNFANYDNNGDGTLDGLQVVHAGYGEEAGAPAYTIWSHQWTLSTYARTYDGVYINTYSTVPELYGASGSTITGAGVLAHEFAHNMGCPDTYDTSGSGAWDLKKWDIMASGSWNNSGNNPPYHNPYTRWQLGWSSPTTLTATTNVTLNNTENYNSIYRYDTTTTNEFFLLENRQLLGNWDYYLPGHGLLIYHIDGNYIATHTSNNINTDNTHQGIDLEEADNVKSSTTYGADPFPGTGAKTSFTDTTTPNAKSWAGANTNKPITSIAEASNVITFTITVGTTSSYCASKSSNYADEWISRVRIGTLDKSSSYSYYSDYTSTSVNLTRGTSYTITLNTGYSGTAYTEYWKVWIDYNKNYSFAETNEAVFSKSGATSVTGTFTCLSTATTGTTRIRVSMKYGAYPSYCESFTYGEVEDYTANIL